MRGEPLWLASADRKGPRRYSTQVNSRLERRRAATQSHATAHQVQREQRTGHEHLLRPEVHGIHTDEDFNECIHDPSIGVPASTLKVRVQNGARVTAC